MPAIAYAALLFGGAIASLVGFAVLGVREQRADDAMGHARARRLALLLAKRRGEFVSFFLNDGKVVAGNVAFVDVDELLVHIDIRKLKRDAKGRLQQHEEAPQATHLVPVALGDVEHAETVTESYEDTDVDSDEEPDELYEGDD